MTDIDYILQAQNLRKEFGSLVAVRDVSINVQRGVDAQHYRPQRRWKDDLV